MLRHLLDWYDLKGITIGNGNSLQTFVLSELDNDGIEGLFNHLSVIKDKIHVQFADEYGFNYDYTFELKSNVLDDLNMFIESFYLAKLLSKFKDYHEIDVSLNVLIATYDVEIAKHMPFEISCQKLLFNALNNDELWHRNFYYDFASFEHFVRFCLNNNTKLELHCGVVDIMLRKADKMDFKFDLVDTIIQNNIFTLKGLLTEIDDLGVDSDWEKLDMDLILFENKRLINAEFRDSSLYEIAKELYYKYHDDIVVNLGMIKFADEDEQTHLWRLRSY